MSKIRVAVAGVSNRGLGMLPSLLRRPDVEVTGICDLIKARAEYARTSLGLARAAVFTSARRMLRDAPCDAVIVTTSDAHHAEVAIPALKLGKYVFCEKPLETTLAKCRAFVAADEAAGGRTFMGHNLRYAPTYVTVKKLIASGAVGQILTIQADEFYDGGRTYFRRWNRLRSEGGGLWVTKASHDFDLLAWLAGAPPVEVQAMAARTYYVPKPQAAMQCRNCRLRPECPDRAPDEAPVLERLREESGGTPYDLCLYNADSDTFDHGVANVMFAGDIFATYTCNVVAGFTDRRIRVAGTRGTLDGALTSGVVTWIKRDPPETVTIPVSGRVDASHGGADERLMDEFISFVKGGQAPECRPREAALAVSLGLAATRSSDRHRAVKVGPFLI